ncbi:MAG: hypothetical protein M0Z95_15120 [Actinomycetota bacterium]|nr:hypothetical protein [Actinomycetota bacterium]
MRLFVVVVVGGGWVVVVGGSVVVGDGWVVVVGGSVVVVGGSVVVGGGWVVVGDGWVVVVVDVVVGSGGVVFVFCPDGRCANDFDVTSCPGRGCTCWRICTGCSDGGVVAGGLVGGSRLAWWWPAVVWLVADRPAALVSGCRSTTATATTRPTVNTSRSGAPVRRYQVAVWRPVRKSGV